jgi:hypothetical protein
MIKWEYLVFSSILEEFMVVGFKLNDEIIRFEGGYDKYGERYKFDYDDVNYKKYHSNGQNQILNELGDEGWELIKIRSDGNAPTYFFKRPL